MVKNDYRVFDLTKAQLERYVKADYSKDLEGDDKTVISYHMTVEEIKEKIWNEYWMIFPMSHNSIDTISYMNNSPMKIMFMRSNQFRRFKKEYAKLM